MGQQFGMHQKMQQRMIMTPMLQQAMKILQMSTLEMVDWVEKEMLENPTLEDESEHPPETAEKTSPTEAAETPSTDNEQEGGGLDPVFEKTRDRHQTDLVDHMRLAQNMREGDNSDENAWGMYKESAEYGDHAEAEWGGRESSDRSQEKRDFMEASITRAETLAEHLEWQLLMSVSGEKEREAARAIIGNLDESGYLSDPLDQIAQSSGVPVGEVENALALVQSFEPAGVGARDLRECLLLQLENRVGAMARKAYRLVSEHFEDMEKKRYPAITKGLRCGADELREVLTYVATLEPKPGRSFTEVETKYITPDVFVRKIEGEYVVVLNDEPVPRLRVSPYYRKMLKESRTAARKETRKFLEGKIQSAIWLIKNIEQRRKTIFRVTEAIFKIQREFLEMGISALKPLTLKQVADMIGMHESTVSRVTTHKYVQTERGIFELKYFFTSGLESSDGMDVSSLSVKERIKELVAQEPPQKPLSDQRIMQALKDGGLAIARRTIAKYREELRIPPASQRRKL